jgi:hypothetical protein
MVVGNRERHQLLKRHAVGDKDVEELRGDGGELQPLLDDGRADEEPGCDVFFAQSLLAQGLECAELVKRVQVLGSVRSVLFGPSYCYRCRFHFDAGRSCILTGNVRPI